jgi:hypothetical protein
MDIHVYSWISIDAHGYPRISMDVHRYPWIAMDIYENPWMSMDIHGYPWFNCHHHEQKISMIILGQSVLSPNGTPFALRVFQPEQPRSFFRARLCQFRFFQVFTLYILCIFIIYILFREQPWTAKDHFGGSWCLDEHLGCILCLSDFSRNSQIQKKHFPIISREGIRRNSV